MTPSLIDDTGPKHRVETWMVLVLTLASPLVYWTMFENMAWGMASLLLLVTMVLVGNAMAHVEMARAKEEPRRYRRGLATGLAAVGWMHLVVLLVAVVAGFGTTVVGVESCRCGGMIHGLPY